jgi:hypothetical protein
MIEVRRDHDGELCGFVTADLDGDVNDAWLACTVFGGRLGRHDREADAIAQVLEHGLAALAERWQLLDGRTGEAQVVCIQEASPRGVTVALDLFTYPGVPTLRISRDDLDEGRWSLTR